MRHRLIMLGVMGIAALVLTGCGSSGKRSASTAAKSASTSTPAVAATSTGAAPSSPAASRIVIPAVFTHLKGRGVSAFVELSVKGRSYLFRVDTGATRTTVDYTFAKALALPDRGAATSETSVCRKVPAQPVEISDWKLGGAALPATRIISTRVAGAGRKTHGAFAGSLGSDVLSRFGIVTFDPAGRRLILGGRAPVGGKRIPMKVGHAPDGEVGLILHATIRGQRVGYEIDTGAGISTIDSRARKRLGLQAAGKSVKIPTGFCGATTFTPVRIDGWTAGGVKLPSTVAVSSGDAITSKSKGKVVGLLGLDVLSTFGEVTFDFAGRRLVLGGTAG